MTWLNIAYQLVFWVSSYQPSNQLLNAIVRLLRYLSSASRRGLLYLYYSHNRTACFSNVDWIDFLTDRRSITRYCGGNLVSWKNKKQLLSLDKIWLILHESLYVYEIFLSTWVLSLTMMIYCDNQLSLCIVPKFVFQRTRYIEVDCHVVWGKYDDGIIELKHASSASQLADLLTKSLGQPQA